MNKNAMIPSTMLATVIAASLTLPVTVSANDTPVWRSRTEHGQPKSGWEGKPSQKPGRDHNSNDRGHEHHYGHGAYSYRGQGYRHSYGHEWHKPHPRIYYYDIHQPHRHYRSNDLGGLRIIFDYDLFR